MVWEQFDETARQQLLDEDRDAWRNIVRILMGIIVVGVLGAAGVVLMIT